MVPGAGNQEPPSLSQDPDLRRPLRGVQRGNAAVAVRLSRRLCPRWSSSCKRSWHERQRKKRGGGARQRLSDRIKKVTVFIKLCSGHFENSLCLHRGLFLHVLHSGTLSLPKQLLCCISLPELRAPSLEAACCRAQESPTLAFNIHVMLTGRLDCLSDL
eukprot:678882-Rhodomonas_salina.2